MIADCAAASDKHRDFWADTQSTREEVRQSAKTSAVVTMPLDEPENAMWERYLHPIYLTGRDLLKDKVSTAVVLCRLSLHPTCGKGTKKATLPTAANNS